MFGEKDYQQLVLIRAMTRALDWPVRVEGVQTVREPDGLAMSSRNRYLSPEQRQQAAALPRAMQAAIATIEGGADVAGALAGLQAEIIAAGFSSVDYAVLADAASLAPLAALGAAPARLLVAARIGGTRLIDNMAVNAAHP